MSRAWPLAWMAAGALAPWLIVQGRRVRRETPELPEPSGNRHGQWQLPWPCDPRRLSQQCLSPLAHPRPLAAPHLSSSPMSAPTQSPGASRLRLLLVGDSSMAGVGAAHQSEALSGALTRELQRNPPVPDSLGHSSTAQGQGPIASLQVDWRIAARTGLRTRDMARALPGLLQAHGSVQVADTNRFDLALVALGVNDATALRSASAFGRDVRTLCQQLREQHGLRRILWSGLPPVHRFPALPQPLRTVLGRKAIELDAVLRDFGADYAPMPAQLDDAWIATDGFHPGPRAYAAWAAQLAPQLRTALDDLAR